MDSKKRKEKILKKINKESGKKTKSSVSGKNSTSKVINKEKSLRAESSSKKSSVTGTGTKKAMFSNDEALNKKKKINHEKAKYRKSQNQEAGLAASVVNECQKIGYRVKRFWRRMKPAQRIRFVGAWVIFILLICVVVTVVSNSDSNKKTKNNNKQAKQTESTNDQQTTTTEEENDNPLVSCDNDAVKQLLTTYFDALKKNDVEAMKNIDMCATSYANTNGYQKMKNVIEDFKNLTIYTQNGPYPDGYVAYVVTDIKFKDIDKTCQGMYCIVVRKQEDGTYKIDTTQDDDIEDDDISNQLETMKQKSDVLALYDAVNAQCQKDIESDAVLKAYVQNTLNKNSATASEEENVTTEEATTEEATTEEATTEKKAEKKSSKKASSKKKSKKTK